MTPPALYEPGGDGVLVPTQLTAGPWDPRHQHAGPPSALLARAVEQSAALHPAHIGRIGVDILRPVPLEPLVARGRILRPGRRVELVEATLAVAGDGTELMRATAWRIAQAPPDLDAGARQPDPPPDGPDGLPDPPRPGFWRDETGYVDALEWRFAHGSFDETGPAACWSRLRVPLVAGEVTRPVEHLLVMADAASGISRELDWSRWLFMNVTFDVHLERPPEGDWLAMDAVTRIGDRGAGVCTGVLSDRDGRVGLSTQSLIVAAR